MQSIGTNSIRLVVDDCHLDHHISECLGKEQLIKYSTTLDILSRNHDDELSY